jgi:transposase
MMGKQKQQAGLFSYSVQLESRVPSQHYLRKIKKALKLSFVRSAVQEAYGYNGNESVDPEVIVKLMLLLFLDDVSSERELMRMLPYRLDYLWFLDYGLDDAIPDHSVLSKARKRWGLEVFQQLFVESVGQCYAAGLVDGKKLFVDGSLVNANASCDSVRKGSPELIEALGQAYQREAGKLEEPEAKEGKGEDDSGGSGGGSGYDPTNAHLLCVTDPDSAVVRHGPLPARPRYKHHRAVDGACGVIVAVASTSGDVAENRELFELVDQAEANPGIEVATVVGDCQYGTNDNFRECAERGIESHLGDLSEKARKRDRGIFRPEQFVYDAEREVYVCPAGQDLKRRHHKWKRRADYYGCNPSLCQACALKPRCTRSETGRTVIRYEGQELIDRARAQSHSYAAKQDRRQRKHVSEGSFADAANHHGFKRSRWRGLWRQQLQDYLIAVCQNLRILIANGFGKPSGAVIQRIESRPIGLMARFWVPFWGYRMLGLGQI